MMREGEPCPDCGGNHPWLGADHDLGEYSCPMCGKIQDRAVSVGTAAPPRDGDYFVCFDCCEFYCWDSSSPTKTRVMTDDERAQTRNVKQFSFIREQLISFRSTEN